MPSRPLYRVREAVISAVTPTATPVQPPADVYSTAEINAMLEAMTTTDHSYLRRRSLYLAQGHYMLASDLRQEAFVRALDGRRQCRRGYDIVNFLIGIMRSLTSQEREAERDGLHPVPLDLDDDTLAMASLAPSPEQVGHDALHYRRTLAAIQQSIGDDPQLVTLLDAVLDGEKGIALQNRLGLDAKGLASVRKQLQRKLAAAAKDRSIP
jgi:hypothetical protein